MGLYSLIWGICIYAVAFATAAALIAVSPYCRSVSQKGENRFSEIDGLRGYLALGVFITHSASMKQWLETGVWDWPPSSFFTMAGTVPVSLFFMITAFLFWGKAIRSRGRIDPLWLLTSRVRRLAPLYLCAIPVLLLLVAIESGWKLRVDLSTLVVAIGRWSLVGAGGSPKINGVEVGHFFGQVWTLWYEWIFYAMLPVAALLWRVPGSIVLIVVVAIATQLRLINPIVLNFAVGIAAAELVTLCPKLSWTNTYFAAALALAALVLPGVVGSGYYSWKQTVCMTPLFICVCFGNSILGLLSNGPTRLLGAVSYSTYLLHLFVLNSMLAVNSFVQIGTLGAYSYWAIIAMLTVILVTMSVITFRFIEQPFMGKARAEGPPIR